MVIFIDDKVEEQLFRDLHDEIVSLRRARKAKDAKAAVDIRQKAVAMLKRGRISTSAIAEKLSVPQNVISAYKAHVTMGTYN